MVTRRVFISYRRTDSSEMTGRLRDRLVQRFGPSSVFLDVDSLGPGDEFRSTLESAVRNCDVFLAMIGPNWLKPDGESSTPRLFNSDDHVRAEIETALQSGVTVIPVLVGTASMPTASSVPSSMSDLVYLNAARLRPDPDFHTDVDRLLASAPLQSDRNGALRRRPSVVGGVALTGLVVGGLVAMQLARSEPETSGMSVSVGSLVENTVTPTPSVTAMPSTTLAGDASDEDETVTGEDVPLAATVSPVLDPINSSYWLQGEMPPHTSWPLTLSDEEFVRYLAAGVGVIPAPSMARLTLENTSDRGMVVNDARYRVVSCVAPDPTASYRANYEGASEVISWGFQIGGDKAGAFADAPWFEQPFFADQVVVLEPGELFPIDLWFETLTEQCDVVVDLDVVFGGQSSVVTIDQDGEPFRTTPEVSGLPTFQRWWGCVAQYSAWHLANGFAKEEDLEDVFIQSDGQWRSILDLNYELIDPPRDGEPCYDG